MFVPIGDMGLLNMFVCGLRKYGMSMFGNSFLALVPIMCGLESSSKKNSLGFSMNIICLKFSEKQKYTQKFCNGIRFKILDIE